MIWSLTAIPVVLTALILCAGWYLSEMIRKSALAVAPTYLWAKDMVMHRQKLGVTRITIPGPLGNLPALYFPGKGTTWLISLHGKGGTMYDNAYGVPYLASKRGIPALAISYRNDQGAPRDPSGIYQYGRTEWRDLEAAVEYATDNGAEDIILSGCSYGGGIVAAWLRYSMLAPMAAAVIFDCPMLDFRQCIRQVAKTLPRHAGRFIAPLLRLAEGITAMRFGIDWRAVDYLADAKDWLRVPALVFHGDKDTVVPVSTSIKLKELLPDLVTLVRDPQLGHGGMAADKKHLPLTASFLTWERDMKEKVS